ncbi:MAG: pyridoxine 5'-phosphate synthase [Phycisphaerae bacterium]|nr:pyridoxine 5'-phosphate synthase [Phycisphaerae bacterium]HBZ97304.1 pyridoxine 5'-phosphate synthase [Phycisphaerales bacterium]
MAKLCVNIDHVATVRQARRIDEPDPLQAAMDAQKAGAEGITVHLREDRRHIQDHDLHRLVEVVERLNLEMAATDEMIGIALETAPCMAMLVPEGRMEITTEGGLDVAGNTVHLTDVVRRLGDGGIPVSAFIDAELEQVEAAAECGFAVCEIHTGPWAHAHAAADGRLDDPAVAAALETVAAAGRAVLAAGMRFNAGHALNYRNVAPVAALDGLDELHIGHSIVSRSIFTGFGPAVAEMHEIVSHAGAKH